MNNYKTQAIVLHTIKYGDKSLVAYMLTDAFGRTTYMVQGVKSSRGRGSKLSLLQPSFILDVDGFETHHSTMHRIREASLLVPLQQIPFDVRKSTIALFIAEVLYRLIREEEANARLFDFAKNSIIALDAMDDGVANFHLWFLVQLSAFLGFYPANECPDEGCFDIVEGGFTSIAPQHRMVFDRANSALLWTMMNCDVSQLGQVQLSRKSRSEFLAMLLGYFDYHLETSSRIESLRILREVF